MDGFLLELVVLASHDVASLIGHLTSREGLQKIRRAATFKNIFSMAIFLFFIHACGSSDDVDSFLNFFTVVYLFSLSNLFKDILSVLGIVWLGYYTCLNHYPTVALVSRQIGEALAAGLHKVHYRVYVFFSLEDGHHVGRKRETKPKKRYLGLPKGQRPPKIDERPQIAPRQQSDGDPQQRTPSGASGSGSRQGSGQHQNGSASGSRQSSGQNQNGSVSGSKRKKGKKKR